MRDGVEDLVEKDAWMKSLTGSSRFSIEMLGEFDTVGIISEPSPVLIFPNAVHSLRTLCFEIKSDTTDFSVDAFFRLHAVQK